LPGQPLPGRSCYCAMQNRLLQCKKGKSAIVPSADTAMTGQYSSSLASRNRPLKAHALSIYKALAVRNSRSATQVQSKQSFIEMSRNKYTLRKRVLGAFSLRSDYVAKLPNRYGYRFSSRGVGSCAPLAGGDLAARPGLLTSPWQLHVCKPIWVTSTCFPNEINGTGYPLATEKIVAPANTESLRHRA
jgi:hypothetical protein